MSIKQNLQNELVKQYLTKWQPRMLLRFAELRETTNWSRNRIYEELAGEFYKDVTYIRKTVARYREILD